VYSVISVAKKERIIEMKKWIRWFDRLTIRQADRTKIIEILVIAAMLAATVLAFNMAFGRTSYNPSGDAEGLTDAKALLSSQVAWNTIDATTSAGTEPTDLAVTERTYVTVVAAIAADASGDGEISYARIPPTWNALRFRAIGITENGTATYQIYLGTLAAGTDCELAKAGQLAFVIGTQASITSGYELADAVTVTAADWAKSWGSASPGSDQCAEAAIDIMGADLVMVVPTTASADCKLIVKGY